MTENARRAKAACGSNATLKAMILGALEAVGGEEYLRRVGREDLIQALRDGMMHSARFASRPANQRGHA